MYKQLQPFHLERICLTDFVCVFSLEEVFFQKHELGRYLSPEFEQLLCLFHLLLQDKGSLDCIWQTKRFPFPRRLIPEEHSRFLKMEREGLGSQKKILQALCVLSPEETFDDLMHCCDTPQKWLPVATELAAMRMNVLNGLRPVHQKRKHKEQEQLKARANFALMETHPPGITSFYKSCVDMYFQTSAFPFLVRWLHSRTGQAIESLASYGLPDEFHLWFSEINIVRLESLLDYAQSCFRSKASTSDVGAQSKHIVREVCQRMQLGKPKAKELQNIFCGFLNSLGQLKNTISNGCSELFKCKSLDRFLQENANVDNMRNQNFIVIDWLATQFSGNTALLHHLESFLSIHKAFTDALRKFLHAKSFPRPLAKKVLEAIVLRCSNSFFSDDHEAIIALKLYSEQNALLMASPRGEKKIPLGFDESLICMLRAVQQELSLELPESFEDAALKEELSLPDPETQVKKELEIDFSSSSPSSTSTDSSEIETDLAAELEDVDAVAEKVAHITLSSPPKTLTTKMPEQGSGRKKLKKQKIQKTTSPISEKKPSVIDEQREIALPLYWRQYCDPNKLIKLAVSAGFTAVRTKGSHHEYIRHVENEPPVCITIPYHPSQDIHQGLARSIVGQILKFNVIEEGSR